MEPSRVSTSTRREMEVMEDPLRVPNRTPMGPREGGRASEARNASQSVASTSRDERDEAWRRPPALARRDEARQAPRGVRPLEQRTTLPCGPFLAVHPAWLHRGLVGVLLGTLQFPFHPRSGSATSRRGAFAGAGLPWRLEFPMDSLEKAAYCLLLFRQAFPNGVGLCKMRVWEQQLPGSSAMRSPGGQGRQGHGLGPPIMQSRNIRALAGFRRSRPGVA